MRFQVLDIEKDIRGQGFAAAGDQPVAVPGAGGLRPGTLLVREWAGAQQEYLALKASKAPGAEELASRTLSLSDVAGSFHDLLLRYFRDAGVGYFAAYALGSGYAYFMTTEADFFGLAILIGGILHDYLSRGWVSAS